MFHRHNDMLTAPPFIPVDRKNVVPVDPRYSVPAPYARPNLEEARIVIEDAIALLSMTEKAKTIARALLKAHDPETVEAMANEIGRHAHMAGRERSA